MGMPDVTAPAAGALKMRVEGMDCSACAIKIENALKRLRGVSDVNVNYGLETLTFCLDQDRNSLGAVEQQIRTLGYAPHVQDGAGGAGPGRANHQEADAGPWWRSPKGRRVVSTAAALLVAAVLSALEPALSYWAYVGAALIGAAPVVRRAVVAALAGTPFSMEMLMSIAVGGAAAIGAAEEAAVVVFLFAVGELLENVAAGHARAGIRALMDLVPRVAQVEEGDAIREVPVERISIGDVVLVRPGDRVPADGEVINGASEVNEAPVTGESVPSPKTGGDTVFAGSINGDGMLRIRATHTAQDNTIARIIHLVEEAQGSKAPTARFIDRFSAWYTPAAMAAAGLVVVVPPLLFGADWPTWIYRGLATLLIACPCALVISTPAAIASGLAAGARRGLLVKGGAALETLGRVATVAFDKTGTLTVGEPKVTDIVAVAGTDDSVLAQAAAVEQGSSHPLGRAIIAAARTRGLAIPPIFGGATATPGKAVQARLRAGFVSVGSPRYAAELQPIPPDVSGRIIAFESEGKTVVVILATDRIVGLIALRDEPRDDARKGIARLRSLGIRTVMLTGDNQRTADAIAGALALEARAGLLPEAKLQALAALKDHGPVAMVGDGINDAPALAASSVGIAMGGGTDVALEAADAALLRNRVEGVAELVELSRAALRNIRQNITVALGLKVVFLTATLIGLSSLWMAILADTGATVIVTANALRLLRFSSASEAK
jgi:Cd2+/Zn2+-exporting ATPase